MLIMSLPYFIRIFCVVIVSTNIILCENEKNKRLVLHSETDLLQEFTNLRSEFESYESMSTSEINALKTGNNQMTTNISALQNENNKLTTYISALQNENNQLKINISSLKTLSNQLTSDVTALQSANNQMASEISTLQSIAVSGTHAVYIRWGRNVCPSQADLVYKGFIGGKKYNDAGNGNNNLCLPSDPTWGRFNDSGATNYRSYIYGTEIDNDDRDHMFPNPVGQQDMPCVVCRTNKSTSLMIPARNNCYPGWQLEYNGYLMANYHGASASYGYICMDQSPEFLQHGGSNDNEHVLYITQGQCGSLPCPPYVHNRELACVVCSK